jgi:hypothetical protein
MQNNNNRKVTRSQVWPETEATLVISEAFGQRSRSLLTIKGSVSDLGSSGMFLITPEMVPVPAKADITIDFDPGSKKSTNLKLSATGETVRSTNEGVGIKFTSIDLVRLQQCIISKMNQTG